jgi:hypothetical protein
MFAAIEFLQNNPAGCSSIDDFIGVPSDPGTFIKDIFNGPKFALRMRILFLQDFTNLDKTMRCAERLSWGMFNDDGRYGLVDYRYRVPRCDRDVHYREIGYHFSNPEKGLNEVCDRDSDCTSRTSIGKCVYNRCVYVAHYIGMKFCKEPVNRREIFIENGFEREEYVRTDYDQYFLTEATRNEIPKKYISTNDQMEFGKDLLALCNNTRFAYYRWEKQEIIGLHYVVCFDECDRWIINNDHNIETWMLTMTPGNHTDQECNDSTECPIGICSSDHKCTPEIECYDHTDCYGGYYLPKRLPYCHVNTCIDICESECSTMEECRLAAINDCVGPPTPPPTDRPTARPTNPTPAPTPPTPAPTYPTRSPTLRPTPKPISPTAPTAPTPPTLAPTPPTATPTTPPPTKRPTPQPTPPTKSPTKSPTTTPPTKSPTTGVPTQSPTDSPTGSPTTAAPTQSPTVTRVSGGAGCEMEFQGQYLTCGPTDGKNRLYMSEYGTTNAVLYPQDGTKDDCIEACRHKDECAGVSITNTRYGAIICEFVTKVETYDFTSITTLRDIVIGCYAKQVPCVPTVAPTLSPTNPPPPPSPAPTLEPTSSPTKTSIDHGGGCEFQTLPNNAKCGDISGGSNRLYIGDSGSTFYADAFTGGGYDYCLDKCRYHPDCRAVYVRLFSSSMVVCIYYSEVGPVPGWTDDNFVGCFEKQIPCIPTAAPTNSPTTGIPSVSPTLSPTDEPTVSPTTSEPTVSPTDEPTMSPTQEPTDSPTMNPTSEPTVSPTDSPTASPTKEPTDSPTVSPTKEPTQSPTLKPTKSPTHNGDTEAPTMSPTTSEPTVSPTKEPTMSPTVSPTDSPTTSPTNEPTMSPTISPTDSPTTSPTNEPTMSPTLSPTDEPTMSPTDSPTLSPTEEPTMSPTVSPTDSPTVSPTDEPTMNPTVSPTMEPTQSPTLKPTKSPTHDGDTEAPTMSPTTSAPTTSPTKEPTMSPTVSPTDSPTVSPTKEPTMSPTVSPTDSPTVSPTDEPTMSPTVSPTNEPTESPTPEPTRSPTNFGETLSPTMSPTTSEPTVSPTNEPTMSPTVSPTKEPTMSPTVSPTDEPTASPTKEPTMEPTMSPTVPTSFPTMSPTKNQNPYNVVCDYDRVDDTKLVRFSLFQLLSDVIREDQCMGQCDTSSECEGFDYEPRAQLCRLFVNSTSEQQYYGASVYRKEDPDCWDNAPTPSPTSAYVPQYMSVPKFCSYEELVDIRIDMNYRIEELHNVTVSECITICDFDDQCGYVKYVEALGSTDCEFFNNNATSETIELEEINGEIIENEDNVVWFNKTDESCVQTLAPTLSPTKSPTKTCEYDQWSNSSIDHYILLDDSLDIVECRYGCDSNIACYGFILDAYGCILFSNANHSTIESGVPGSTVYIKNDLSCLETRAPTKSPTTLAPSASPTAKPTESPVTPAPTTFAPTLSPTLSPTFAPTIIQLCNYARLPGFKPRSDQIHEITHQSHDYNKPQTEYTCLLSCDSSTKCIAFNYRNDTKSCVFYDYLGPITLALTEDTVLMIKSQSCIIPHPMDTIRGGCNYTESVDQQYFGEPVNNLETIINVTSVTQCSGVCDINSECISFSYDSEFRRCVFFSNVTGFQWNTFYSGYTKNDDGCLIETLEPTISPTDSPTSSPTIPPTNVIGVSVTFIVLISIYSSVCCFLFLCVCCTRREDDEGLYFLVVPETLTYEIEF